METKTVTVPNISCHHCTRTIENELGELAGVASVKAEVESKNVTVTWDAPASLEKILATLKEINYPAAE
ncbi:MAG: heavy-metal-associated domain-containing protein [Desulfobacterales bacterium]|jgi:copper ion binding protein|nr:heavy-metal-associated domain-containing protein [Desulfobacteraceae bacterium]MDD3993144.1 heavy-metal-associated domain-containing protein [Desulfobacteraceae bacterium]MDY0313177.1 heavy-metal-associated domain-containing protein [Desulfobacterales bacterium]